jgi:hypothetical protein
MDRSGRAEFCSRGRPLDVDGGFVDHDGPNVNGPERTVAPNRCCAAAFLEADARQRSHRDQAKAHLWLGFMK